MSMNTFDQSKSCTKDMRFFFKLLLLLINFSKRVNLDVFKEQKMIFTCCIKFIESLRILLINYDGIELTRYL